MPRFRAVPQELRFARISRTIFRRRAASLEQQVYTALVRKGDLVFDVGANVGQTSAFIAGLIGKTGSIVAFEPLWPIYRELCHNLRILAPRDATVIPVPFGLAESAGTRQMSVPEGISELASLADGSRWQAAHRITWSNSYQASFRRLDEFLETTKTPIPQFIKIDVEGAENLVLDGAGESLDGAARPLMLIELFAPWQRVMGYHPYDLLGRLTAKGYRFIFVCPDGLVTHVPTRDDPFPAAYRNGYNVIAFVPDFHDERVRSLRSLMSGSGGRILHMHPAPQPNVIT